MPIAYADVEKQFPKSPMLPILQKIFNATAGLAVSATVALTGKEAMALLRGSDMIGMQPTLAIPWIFGMLLPGDEPPPAKFFRETGLTIVVLLGERDVIYIAKHG